MRILILLSLLTLFACSNDSGYSKTYHENGQLKSIGKYVNGKRVGTWKSFSKMTESYNITDYDDQ